MSDRESSERDLDVVLSEWDLAQEAGRAPDVAAISSRYPHLMPDLASALKRRQTIKDLMAPLRRAAVADDPSESSPIRFGRYQLLKTLGSGGMGVVYRAQDDTSGRLVALKRPHPALASQPRCLARFRQEARLTASLDHPNIVRVLDIDEIDGEPYFTMALIDGHSLDHQEHRRFFLEHPDALCAPMALVAGALHHAHERGILHRDVKPSNILLDRDGVPFVTDFGLAKDTADPQDLTTSHETPGTPDYAAPELWDGRNQPTWYSDIYSLGVVLYELITGTPPGQGATLFARRQSLRDGGPVNPQVRNAAVPRWLAHICLRCLERNHLARYAGAQRLGDALVAGPSGLSLPMRIASRARRVWQFGRRRAGWLTAAAALLVLLLSAGVRKAEELGQRAESLRTNTAVAAAIGDEFLGRMRQLAQQVESTARRPDLRDRMRDWNDHRRAQGDATTMGMIKASPAMAAFQEALFQLHAARDVSVEIWHVLDDAGTVVARAPMDGNVVASNFRDRDYFKGAFGHKDEDGLGIVHVSDVYRSVANQHLYQYDLSAPILDDDRTVLGVIGLAVTTDASLGLPRLHDDRRTAVLVAPGDRNRRAQDPPQHSPMPPYLVVQHPAYLRGDRAAEFKLTSLSAAFPRRCDRELSLTAIRVMPLGVRGYIDPLGETNPTYRGSFLAGLAPVGNTGFFVVVEQRERE